MLFQPGFMLASFPLGCHVPCFDGKVLPLLSSARFFTVRDLHRQLTPALFICLDVYFELAILFLEGGYPRTARLCQVFQALVSARRHELAFGQFRVHDPFFRVAVIRVQIERDQPVANAVFLARATRWK
jgi:hypothetical protein